MIHENTKDMVCPFCDRGHDYGIWYPEYDSNFNMNCSECGKEFSVELKVELTFTTKPIGGK